MRRGEEEHSNHDEFMMYVARNTSTVFVDRTVVDRTRWEKKSSDVC